MKDNAELWGAIYKKLQQIDENRKFRKTIDKRQVTLEESIARKLKELKNADNSKRKI
jgi:hypothetical protein